MDKITIVYPFFRFMQQPQKGKGMETIDTNKQFK